MRHERKPAPTDDILKQSHEHELDREHDRDRRDRMDARDTAADRPHSPIVVERVEGADRDDPAHTHAHADHVHSHPHGDISHSHGEHDEPPRELHRTSDTSSGTSIREDREVLFPQEESQGYRSRWEAIQTGFVDEPRAAVEQADALVSQITSRLNEVFTRERQSLEEVWGRGDNASTEDLRIALKRYRAFFDRLLSL